MINPKELRIGNYIIDDDGCVAKINGFNPFDHGVRCDEAEGCILLIDIYHELTGKWKLCREADSPECAPIPLTREWLERCGYEYSKSDEKWYKSGSLIGPIYFIYERTYGIQGLGIHPGNRIKHLHQLQNLYFALTGEELAITDPVS